MDFVGVWAVRLVRRSWRATVLLALLSGLAAGVAMTATAAGRRSATAFGEFLAFADIPELVYNICPPEVTELDPEALQRCTSYVPNAERAVMAALTEVDEAVVASFRGVTIAPASSPEAALAEVALVTYQAGAPRLDGRQLIVRGRAYDPEAPDEITVNERVFRALGIDVGDEVELTFWSEEELGMLSPVDGAFHGESVRANVVGVSRGLMELGDNRSGTAFQELSVLAGPGIAEATPNTDGYTGVVIRAGADRAETADAIAEALPDMLANVGAAVEDDQIDSIRDSIRYEAYGVMAFGGLAAGAVAVFCGQAIARQTRRDWLDLPTLRALGVTRTQARQATVARAAVVAGLAIVVAGVTTVAGSPIGPVGVARDAELDLGVAVDWTVLLLGSVLIAAVVLASSLVTIRRSGASAHPRATTERVWGIGRLGPAGSAGLAMSRPTRGPDQATPLGTAVTGSTLAVLTIVAALGMRASLDGLREEPARMGAPWDLSIAAADDDPRAADALALLAERELVAAAAGIVGVDAEIEGHAVWVHAFAPVDGVESRVPPPVLTGRAPSADDEIALGELTRRDLGAELGDTVVLGSTSGGEPQTLTVVGTAIINDTYESCGGCGGIVTPGFVATFAPEASVDPVVFQLVPGTDVDAVVAELSERFPAGALGPVAQQAVRNVERIRQLPTFLALLASSLALASVTHALVLSLRRHRGELAVLRVIGFTRRQIRVAVVTHGASLGVVAVAVGVPLGLVVARQGWRLLVERIGVALAPQMPIGGVVLAVGAVLAAIVVVSLIAGQAAMRARPASTLRVE